MKTSAISVLENKKHFSTFYPGYRRYAPYSSIQLTLLNTEMKDDLIITGFIDVLHKLPAGILETMRRIVIQKKDFKNNVASYSISTGDLVERIRIGLFYENLPEGILLEQEIIPISDKDVTPMPFSYNKIPLHFLDFIRTLPKDKFLAHLSKELHALEAAPIKDPTETFKKWVIADKIIRLSGTGEIDMSYLDWSAQNLFNSYATIKEELGLSEIVV